MGSEKCTDMRPIVAHNMGEERRLRCGRSQAVCPSLQILRRPVLTVTEYTPQKEITLSVLATTGDQQLIV